MDKGQNGQRLEWTKVRMDKGQNGQRLEWVKIDFSGTKNQFEHCYKGSKPKNVPRGGQ